MGLSTISLIVLLASGAVLSARQREICACIPINVCPKANRFSRDDAKYFLTVLKCKEEGFIRCCPHNDITDAAARRSDDAENIILIDDVHEKFDTASESIETTTMDADLPTTTEMIEEFTTEVVLESERQPKAIDSNVAVIYPKNSIEDEKQKAVREHLFLIFPNGEIEAAQATEKPTSIKPMKRVVVRKRLVTKAPEEFLQEAESKLSQAVIEPEAMDIEEVKQRLSDMQGFKRRKINKSSPITTTTSTTTEEPIEETTKRALKKKKKFRKRLQTTTAVIPSTKALKVLAQAEEAESTTLKTIRKVVYNTRGRVNFLKRPQSQQTADEDEEREVLEVSTEQATTSTAQSTTGGSRRRTTTTKPAEFLAKLEPFFAAVTPRPKVLKQAARIDLEHKMMIETVHKALSAIHSGVDMKFVEKMIESHRSRMKEVRKNPTTTESSVATRPYRGSARFRKPATTPTSLKDLRPTATAGTRTRNLSRTRNTVTTTLTTHKSVRKSPKTLMTQTNPVINAENTLLEEVDMPPKQKAPKDFRASPLYGITMDKDTEMDGDELDKIHETFLPPSTGGFFPVIHNGTPSTLI